MVHTIFSLSIPSAYLISKLQGATLIGGRRLHEGGLFQRKKSQSYEISKLPLNYFKPKVKKIMFLYLFSVLLFFHFLFVRELLGDC